MNVARTVSLGFLIVILTGTILLMLPFAMTPAGLASLKTPVDYVVTALFTATSAVCVTGLSVVDVGQFYTFWGQFFICALVQVGGLGYMTATTFLLLILGRRLALRDKVALQQTLDAPGIAGMVQVIKSIIGLTLLFELTGVFLLLFAFVPEFGFNQGLWFAIFHSVNSFNNAGFSTFSNSLINYVSSPLVVTTVSSLIIFGGIGYQAIVEFYLWTRDRITKNHAGILLSLHFKVVVSSTICLLVFGTLAFFKFEFYNPDTLGNLSLGEKFLAAWFQSVTPRTAGFNTVDISKLTAASLVLTMIFMFIGASPGSTGGGIKTTTTRLLLAATRTAIKNGDEVRMYERTISQALIFKAVGVAISALLVVVVSTLLITLTDGEEIEFLKILFEVVSAFATVGLSTGITGILSISAKFVIIITMFIGRVGILLLISSFKGESEPRFVRYPEENLLVG